MPSVSTVFLSFAAKTCIRQPEGLDLEFRRIGHPGEISPCVLALSTGQDLRSSTHFFLANSGLTSAWCLTQAIRVLQPNLHVSC